MAEYVRFEIYVPVIYQFDGKATALDAALLFEFVSSTVAKYGGVTQANPVAPAPFKGWWSNGTHELVADYLTYVFGLVRVDQFDEATEYFIGWKARLEAAENQDIILVTYSPVHVLGGFLQ